jgi:hypothetical protein
MCVKQKMLIHKDEMSQTAREHELSILPVPDIYFLRLTKSHTYLYSEIPTEESYDFTVGLPLPEQSVRGVLFSLMVR